MTTPGHHRFGDIGGAFADGAVLFPLLLALAWQTGASAAVMLATTGAAYLATGWLFRLPIPVQPLKSLAILAIASGASAVELQIAGVLLGAIYLALSAAPVNRIAERIPDVLIHGFQLGLGIMLMITALKLLGPVPLELALIGAAALAVLLATQFTTLPLLGLLAIGGLLWGLWHAGPVTVSGTAGDGLRGGIIALMVLPQVALTMTNSVLGTQRAARAYYAAAAARVTPRRLLGSLGVGNLLVGAAGGMPYCHGSGGVTAHYRGGSRTALSNVVIGGTLLLLAAWLTLRGGGLPDYPAALQALLLLLIGLFHLKLAAPSWKTLPDRATLLLMGLAALAVQNMLAVLVAGVVALTFIALRRRRLHRTPALKPAPTPVED